MGIGVFHTVIFDLDGTLSDSAIMTMAALKYAAPIHGLPVPSEEAIRNATGYANPEFYHILFPDYPYDLVENCGKLVGQEELRILPSVSHRLLFDGCRELLVYLREHDIHLNIASTGDRDHVFSIVNETGIIGLFDKISCGCPDKTGMLREMLGKAERNGYIMVGDMKKDFEAARANSILSVGACYGYCRQAVTDFDFYIDAPHDLLDILKIQGSKICRS